MLFNSYIFIFVFLPLCLAGYFLLHRLNKPTLALMWLFGMSLWFYGYFNPWYLFIIVSSILANYGFYLLSLRQLSPLARRLFKYLAVCANVGLLFYFKYYDFFIYNINSLFATEFVLKNILLPLGISFFTFQQLSFVIDAFNGEMPRYDFFSYACFVSFFPQLIAGPIVTHDELVPQLMDEKRRRFDFDSFSAGLFIFAMGLAKKVLLADTLGSVADHCFAVVSDYRFEQINSAGAWVAALSFTLQLYFDFSGYSDMAIGIGRMFNVQLPQNFNSPYKALSMTEHWKRWHLTLTRFLTRYVYIPLGGSRRGEGRTYVNIMLVYLVSGIWHGAGWTFIVWGLMHGAASCFCRMTEGLRQRIPAFFNWLFTFLFVLVVNVVFKASSLKDAWYIISRMLRMGPGELHPEILGSFSQPEAELLSRLFAGMGAVRPELFTLLFFLAAALFIALVPKNSSQRLADFSFGPAAAFACAGLIIWCILSFAGVSTFLYFNF